MQLEWVMQQKSHASILGMKSSWRVCLETVEYLYADHGRLAAPISSASLS